MTGGKLRTSPQRSSGGVSHPYEADGNLKRNSPKEATKNPIIFALFAWNFSEAGIDHTFRAP